MRNIIIGVGLLLTGLILFFLNIYLSVFERFDIGLFLSILAGSFLCLLMSFIFFYPEIEKVTLTRMMYKLDNEDHRIEVLRHRIKKMKRKGYNVQELEEALEEKEEDNIRRWDKM